MTDDHRPCFAVPKPPLTFDAISIAGDEDRPLADRNVFVHKERSRRALYLIFHKRLLVAGEHLEEHLGHFDLLGGEISAFFSAQFPRAVAVVAEHRQVEVFDRLLGDELRLRRSKAN